VQHVCPRCRYIPWIGGSRKNELYGRGNYHSASALNWSADVLSNYGWRRCLPLTFFDPAEATFGWLFAFVVGGDMSSIPELSF
jgi:hypothetical protein